MDHDRKDDMVLVLGLPRTGTQTLKGCWKVLNHPRMYHMSEVPETRTHAKLWNELIHRKMENPDELLAWKDFDPILVKYPGGVSDFPAALFGVDLIHAYPSAKVIITERDEDAWLESINRTLVVSHKELEREREASLARGETQDDHMEERYQMRKAYHTMAWKDDFATYGRAYWRKYQQDVRAAAKSQRADSEVLVFNPKQGWEPLCRFLGKPVPEGVPFPHLGSKDNWSQAANPEEQ